jgi:hypothetical protein
MRLAAELSLSVTQQAFPLSKDDLENQYFDRFESICEEVKGAKPPDAVEMTKRRTRRRKD